MEKPKLLSGTARARGLALAALIIIPAAAAAQDMPTEAARPGREVEAQQGAAGAAGQAAQRRLVEGDEVTYEAVLADPDNNELNYKWARTQVAKGDVRGAAATLERMLLVNPNQPKVRLFYALVLYRLDNMGEAGRELDTLQASRMPDSLRSELGFLRREILKRQKRTRFEGLLGLGFAYDSNRNAAPAGGKSLVGDAIFQLTGNALRRDDQSLVSMGSFKVVRDLGMQGGHEAFGSVSYFRSDQQHVKFIDLQAWSLRAGGVVNTPWLKATPTLLFDHVLLSRHTFLRSLGWELRGDRKVGPKSNGWLSVGYQYQDYPGTREAPTTIERAGSQWEVAAGADFQYAPAHKFSAGLSNTVKNAARDYNANMRSVLNVGHLWLVGKGMFLLSDLAAGLDRYEKADRNVSSLDRSDDNYRFRMTYGAPMSLLAKPLKDLMGTLTYEYYHAMSNIMNYGYSNNRWMLMFTYKWEAAS